MGRETQRRNGRRLRRHDRWRGNNGQTGRLAGGGREKKLQVGGSWWTEKARRGRGNTVPGKSARRK